MSTRIKKVYKWTDAKVLHLIKLIKENEAIYNTKHRDHYKYAKIEEIWNDIDMKLEKPPGYSKDKYIQLRNTFKKEYDDASDKKKPSCWIFYTKLTFLIPYLRKKTDNNSLDKCLAVALDKYRTEIQKDQAKEEEMEHLYEIIEFDSREDFYENDVIIDESTRTDINEQIEMEPAKKKSRVKLKEVIKTANVVSTKPLEPSENQPHTTGGALTSSSASVRNSDASSFPPEYSLSFQQQCSCKTDPDAMFLQSLLPDISTMSRKDKGLFKIKIQQIIQDILFKE